MESRPTTRDWWLFHLLAAWSVASIAVVVVADAVFSVPNVSTFAELAALSPGSIALRVTVGLGGVAAIWLWVQMIRAFFRARPSERRAAWGIALFAGLVVGGLLYFWFVWRTHGQSGLKSAAA
jgi:hypothetical protein